MIDIINNLIGNKYARFNKEAYNIERLQHEIVETL